MMKDWTGNKNSIFTPLGASSHTSKERETDDYYATDPIVIDKLLTVETPNHRIWECAAGDGHLSERLKERGFEVCSTDIKERGYPLDGLQDFLTATKSPFEEGQYDILTNPPYKYAKEFVLRALELLPDGCKCYMFLKIQFLEGQARYEEIFSKYPPEKVLVFSKRVSCAMNGEFQRMKDGGGSAVAYAWFVWKKGSSDPIVIDWI